MASLLIVDDEGRIREMLAELFSEEHQCHTAASADAALTLLAAQSYDVVITDLAMPGMSGEDFVGIVRTYQPRTPILVISGAVDRARVESLMRKGVFGYLLKPFRLQDIVDKVKQAIEYRLRHSKA